jgi:hypothetical protein
VRRFFELVPIFGLVLFVALYFYAASLYPGGTRLDHASMGYAHLQNFWCDLLDEPSYVGLPNRGRPIALAATVLLPLSLIPFWFFVPTLFRSGKRTRTVVSVGGISSMVIASFLPVAHDLALDGACAILLVTCAVSFVCLFRSGEFTSLILAAIAAAISTVNFIMWKTGYRLDVMPVVQKAAMISSFVWIAVTSLRYIRKRALPKTC